MRHESFYARLDLELETQGWRERERHFDAMIAAARAGDCCAYAVAKAKFDELTPRDAETANNRPATDQ